MTPSADEQPLSRRQLRELQKSGRATTPDANDTGSVAPDDEQAYATVSSTEEVIETAVIVPDDQLDGQLDESSEPLAETTTTPTASDGQATPDAVPAIPADGVPLTRRQARELERARTASITVISADHGAVQQETGEVVTAEPIDDATGEHAPVRSPDAELQVVEKNASETGDLTEVTIDPDDGEADPEDGTAAPSTTVADGFGEAALRTDSDPLDDEKPFDALIATGIAEAEQTPTTSSTLIVGSPITTFTGPIGGTGEIMVTGSIDLPRTLSGTADPGTGDRADYDRSLDHEPPAPPTAGTPVSASRAVSTHTSARDIIAPPARSKRPSIVPVLAIIAGVLMVAVLAVVVTSLLTGTL